MGVGCFEVLVGSLENMRLILSFIDALSAGFGSGSAGIAPFVACPFCALRRGEGLVISMDRREDPEVVEALLFVTEFGFDAIVGSQECWW